MMLFCPAASPLRRPRAGWAQPHLSPRMSAEPLAARRSAGPALRRFAQAGEWSELASAIRGMWARGKTSEAARPDERLVAMAASLAADAGEFSVAARLFSEMRSHDVAPGPHSYSVMLKAYGRSLDAAGVNRVLSEIDERAVPLDTVLLNSAADALVRTGQLREAESFVKANRGMRDSRTYNILIRGLVEQGRVRDAFRLARGMRGEGVEPNDVTRNTLLAGCVRAGEYARAWELADEIAGEAGGRTVTAGGGGEAGELNQLSVALTALVTGSAAAGRTAEAHALLAAMSSRGAPATAVTYAALIRAFLRRGCTAGLSAAESVYASAPEAVLASIGVHNAFVGGLCRTGERACVHRALAAAYALHKRGDPPPNEETYNALVDGCARVGDLARAERVVRIMAKREVAPSVVTYTILVRGYGERGQAGRAILAFSRLRRAGLAPDRVALNALVAACARGGDEEFATKVVDAMEREGGARGPTCASYAPLVSAAGRRRDLDSAWRAYARMKSAGVSGNDYVRGLVVGTLRRLGPQVVWGGRADERRILAKRCAEVLQDGVDGGTDVRKLRQWRRQMLGMFGKRKQMAREMETVRLGEDRDLTSASERIFERHGWNEIDSGFSVL